MTGPQKQKDVRRSTDHKLLLAPAAVLGLIRKTSWVSLADDTRRSALNESLSPSDS